MITLEQTINKVKNNAPNQYARTYAMAWERASEEAKAMGLTIEEGQKTQICYILANLEDYPTGNMQCLDCDKVIEEDSEDFEYLQENDVCPNCNSMNIDEEFGSWDSPEGQEVRAALKYYKKILEEKLQQK